MTNNPLYVNNMNTYNDNVFILNSNRWNHRNRWIYNPPPRDNDNQERKHSYGTWHIYSKGNYHVNNYTFLDKVKEYISHLNYDTNAFAKNK